MSWYCPTNGIGQMKVKFVRYDGADDGLIALLTTGRVCMMVVPATSISVLVLFFLLCPMDKMNKRNVVH